MGGTSVINGYTFENEGDCWITSIFPTSSSTTIPTNIPTISPTNVPTVFPTESPTPYPTQMPSITTVTNNPTVSVSTTMTPTLFATEIETTIAEQQMTSNTDIEAIQTSYFASTENLIIADNVLE